MAYDYGYVDNAQWRKIYVDNTRVNQLFVDVTELYSRQVWSDHGINMKSAAIKLGNGGSDNPVSGGSRGAWTLAFYFTWNSAKGGCLMYHFNQQRESIIKLENSGQITVWAARYDTGNDKTWRSTKYCQAGRLNCVVVTSTGLIFINGENATPGTYGGDMNLWGSFKIFPDRDIDGLCMGVQGWNWAFDTSYTYVSNPLTWPYETDPSNFAMNFDNNIAVRANTLNKGGASVAAGSPTYDWRRCDYERVTF